jgi:hypothetical protein
VRTLTFLSPDQAAPEVQLVSPLSRVEGVQDVSALGKLELRGDLDRISLEHGDELIRITPERGLLVREGSTESARSRLREAGLRVYDLTGALAGLELEGERLLRRLTTLDPEALPAVGPIARGVPAIIERRDGERFRIFVPQELGHYVAEVVLDMQQGLEL